MKMENFKEIRSVWEKDANNSVSSGITVENIINKHIRKKKNKNLGKIILLFSLLAIICFLLLFASFQMWTTYVGLCIFLVITFYIIYLRSKGKSENSKLEILDNNEFLSALKKEKQLTCVGTTKQQTNLFVFYAIGFGFYIYETVSGSTTALIIGYGALVIYLLAAKFFYFPLVAKRNQRKIDETIKQINALLHQFEENK